MLKGAECRTGACEWMNACQIANFCGLNVLFASSLWDPQIKFVTLWPIYSIVLKQHPKEEIIRERSSMFQNAAPWWNLPAKVIPGRESCRTLGIELDYGRHVLCESIIPMELNCKSGFVIRFWSDVIIQGICQSFLVGECHQVCPASFWTHSLFLCHMLFSSSSAFGHLLCNFKSRSLFLILHVIFPVLCSRLRHLTVGQHSDAF